ncbi:MAG TPA: hypothetical protein VHJ20_00295 [Polyangia bacterium]|nr:hypothetical protein [Polyangia bacterium]
MKSSRRMAITVFAVLVSLAGAARAQSTCEPACGAGMRCIGGECLPNPDATPPAAATPAPAPDDDDNNTPPAQAPTPIRHAPPREDDGSVPARQRGVLVLPFAGAHIVQGIASDDYDAGLRAGLLLGVHLTPAVSMNVELALDSLNVANTGDNKVSGHDLTIAFSPLFHAPGHIGELVVGPILGYWSDNFTATTPDGTAHASQLGWTFGANVGSFIAVTPEAEIGLLVSYQFTSPGNGCTAGPTSDIHDCTNTSLFPLQILGITVAAVF